MTYRASILTPALALLAALSAAAQKPPINLNNPQQIAAGRKLFDTTCAGYCHGEDGAQGRCPRLRGRSDLGIADIHDTIVMGRRGAGKIMPSWQGQLSAKQIWQLTAFIHSLRNEK